MRSFRHISAVAARQKGVVRTDQTGLNSAGITRALRARLLERHYRGVFSVGPLARDGELLAAVFAAGEDAGLGSLTAAVHWQISRIWDPEITVVVPKRRRPQPGFRLLIKPDLDRCDITTFNGIPVTTVARTLVDLAQVLTPEQLANVIHEAAYKNRFHIGLTREAMARSTSRKLRVLEKALELHEAGSAGTRSKLEDRFLKLTRAARLPDPIINTRFLGFEIDFRWPGLCVEIDGPGHDRPRSRVDDRIQDAALEAHGFTTLRFREEELDDPAAVLRQLAA